MTSDGEICLPVLSIKKGIKMRKVDHSQASKSSVSGHQANARSYAQKLVFEGSDSFRLLVDGVRDYGIFMLDPEGYIQTWNAGAERIKG